MYILENPHFRPTASFFYKEDGTSDETKIKSDSSSESGLLSGNTRRRKRSRRPVAATADSSTTKDKPSLINLMLASKESLVSHCLWRRNLRKAQEVIEVTSFCIT